jgi:pimeloyl-ACP methyl ester carboxylesterase
MCADRDEFNDVEDNLHLYRAMPNAELLVVPHSDHLGMVRHPVVHDALQEFYARLPRS